MKLTWLWLLPLLQVRAVPGNAAIYERIYYWYAYELDTAGDQVAPGCAAQLGRRCNFAEFQNWIKGTATVDASKLSNIDPDNIFEAAQKLEDGGYRGEGYDTSRVHKDVTYTNDINKAREEIDFFMHNKVQGANSFRLANIQAVVTYIADVRTGNMGNAVRVYLRQDIPDLVVKREPILDGKAAFEAVDVWATAKKVEPDRNLVRMKVNSIQSKIREIQKVKAPYSIRAYLARARSGAKVVIDACERVT